MLSKCSPLSAATVLFGDCPKPSTRIASRTMSDWIANGSLWIVSLAAHNIGHYIELVQRSCFHSDIRERHQKLIASEKSM
jgi:hypothetical protein